MTAVHEQVKTLMKLLKSALICGTGEILEINLKQTNIQNGKNIKGSSIENVLKHVLVF